jgi:hypothetical protein
MKRTFIVSKETEVKSMAYANAIVSQLLGETATVAVDVYEIEPTRTIEQNDKMWAMLNDVAKQVEWQVDGALVKLSADEWKDIFTASLKKLTKVARGIDGGFVVLGASTKKMGVKAMSDLIEVMYAFGAEHDVKWSKED